MKSGRMVSFTVDAAWAAVVVDMDAVKNLVRHRLVSAGLWIMRRLRTVLLNVDVVFVGGDSILEELTPQASSHVLLAPFA